MRCSSCAQREPVSHLGFCGYCTEVMAPAPHRQAPLFDTQFRRMLSRIIEGTVGETHRIALERSSLQAAKDLAAAFALASQEIYAWIEEREAKFREVWGQ